MLYNITLGEKIYEIASVITCEGTTSFVQSLKRKKSLMFIEVKHKSNFLSVTSRKQIIPKVPVISCQLGHVCDLIGDSHITYPMSHCLTFLSWDLISQSLLKSFYLDFCSHQSVQLALENGTTDSSLAYLTGFFFLSVSLFFF